MTDIKGQRVWVVSHCEVFLQPGRSAVDEVVTYVASSKASALRLIRATRVDPGTWWRLEPARVDEIDIRGCASELYSREGRRLKTAPVEKGYRAAIPRYRKNLASVRRRLAEFSREGRPKRDLDILRGALKSIQSCLMGHS